MSSTAPLRLEDEQVDDVSNHPSYSGDLAQDTRLLSANLQQSSPGYVPQTRWQDIG